MKRVLYILLIAVAVMAALPCSAGGFSVVLDPGHGGKDTGARGRVAWEKNVNLDVARRLWKLLSSEGVNVTYTRRGDEFVDLYQRAATANEIKADLFVSIHCNSMGAKTAGRERVAGAVTYVMGVGAMGANLEVAHRENSVISMEEDFSTRYQSFDVNSDESHIIFELNQRQHLQRSLDFAQEVQRSLVREAKRSDAGVHQAEFIVLAHTAMPAVLIELDYISNPECEAFMVSAEGAQALARAIADAVSRYRVKVGK